jgi:hypothetical protein
MPGLVTTDDRGRRAPKELQSLLRPFLVILTLDRQLRGGLQRRTSPELQKTRLSKANVSRLEFGPFRALGVVTQGTPVDVPVPPGRETDSKKEIGVMAKVILIGLEQPAAGQICGALAIDSHQIEQQPHNVAMREILDADIVFAGGEPTCYISLLKRVREARPSVPFVVITRTPDTREWLDALEAGATDYCSVPIDTRQLHWMLESVLPRSRFAAG